MLIVYFCGLGFYRLACRIWDVMQDIKPSDLD